MQAQTPPKTARKLRPDEMPDLVLSLGYQGNYQYLTSVRFYSHEEALQILEYHGVTQELADPEMPEPREYGRIGAMPTAQEIAIAKYYWGGYLPRLKHSDYFWAVKEELGLTQKALTNALKNTNMQPSQVAEREKQEKLAKLLALADEHPEWNMKRLGEAVGVERSTATTWLRKARRGY